MIKKLKYKFVLINMALITLVLLAIFVAIYASTEQRLAEQSLAILQRALTEEDHREPPPRGDQGPMRNPDFMPVPTFTVILDGEGNVTQSQGALFDLSDQATLQEIVADSLKSGHSSGIISNADLRYLVQKADEGTKIAFVDRSMELQTLSSLIWSSLLVGLISLLVFLVISLYLAKWALRPVEESWQQQRQFVADASHELKTPLTVILANAGIVLAHPENTVQSQAKWIEYIKTEAARMSSLVDNLLFLARTDNVESPITPVYLNISDLAWESILPFESVVFEQHKQLETEIKPGLYIDGDEGKLKQLLGILLDNACKYTDDGGIIKVGLGENKEGKVQLSVTNSGTPIPAQEMENIFRRFYRVDKSRSREMGGYGLGLAIAQSIVDIHHGQISVRSNSVDGTTFTVTF
jgi:two-component system, OmpR family, sensor histidine kinase CiaH